MSDVREVFPVLVDDASGAGEALVSRTEGEASSGKAGSIGFAYKDSSGNVVLPQLDSSGRIPVVQDAPGTCKRGRALHASGSQTVGTYTTALTIALTASKVYQRITITASCFRNGVIQLVHNDDGTEEILWDGIVGSGLFTIDSHHDCLEFTAGATGTQELLVKWNPTDKASDFRTAVSLIELA